MVIMYKKNISRVLVSALGKGSCMVIVVDLKDGQRYVVRDFFLCAYRIYILMEKTLRESSGYWSVGYRCLVRLGCQVTVG